MCLFLQRAHSKIAYIVQGKFNADGALGIIALELHNRRKFEPGQPLISRVEPGQNPVKVPQYETLFNSYRIDRI